MTDFKTAALVVALLVAGGRLTDWLIGHKLRERIKTHYLPDFWFAAQQLNIGQALRVSVRGFLRFFERLREEQPLMMAAPYVTLSVCVFGIYRSQTAQHIDDLLPIYDEWRTTGMIVALVLAIIAHFAVELLLVWAEEGASWGRVVVACLIGIAACGALSVLHAGIMVLFPGLAFSDFSQLSRLPTALQGSVAPLFPAVLLLGMFVVVTILFSAEALRRLVVIITDRLCDWKDPVITTACGALALAWACLYGLVELWRAW